MNEILDFYTPIDLPQEIRAYEAELRQLGAGKAGKVGAMAVKLEYDSSLGKTVIKEQYSRVPLFAQRALYLEESLPSMAYLYVISPSGGILQGDRYRMDITLQRRAVAHITTQGATRIYRMERNYATQIVNVSLGDGCYLEFIPEQVIPYRNSRFYQEVNLTVHDNATLVYSEILVPGRVHSGESFEYDIAYTKVIAKDQTGVLKFMDVAMIEPKRHKVTGFGFLGGFSVFGTVYILVSKKDVSSLKEKIDLSLMESHTVFSGTSILPSNCGLILRLLSDSSDEMKRAIYNVVTVVRKAILNAEFTKIRKS
jgi:urease accessory protein